MEVSRADVSTEVKLILADLLERQPAELDDSRDLQDLTVDSLMFLEAFEHIKNKYDLAVDLNALRAYLKSHPISTVGEMVSSLHHLVLSGSDVSELRI